MHVLKENNYTKEQILLAKTEALDKFFSDNIEEFASSWDLNFIASIKDWQVKEHRHLTDKQAMKLEQIYRDYARSDEHGASFNGVYNYENYLR